MYVLDICTIGVYHVLEEQCIWSKDIFVKQTHKQFGEKVWCRMFDEGVLDQSGSSVICMRIKGDTSFDTLK